MHSKKAYIAGSITAVILIGILLQINPAYARAFLALLLATTAGVYFGASLDEETERSQLLLETSITAIIFLLAFSSIFFSSICLAIGFALHGVWDVLRHRMGMGFDLRGWYPPFCAIFDFLIAIFIIFRL